MADDLSAPLIGRKRRRDTASPARVPRSFPVARSLFALLGLIVVGVGARILLVDQPDGGRPFAEVEITAAPDSNPLATALSGKRATIEAGPEMPIGGGPAINLESTSAALETGAEPEASGIIPDLAEQTQFGAIPRLGPGGETPFAAYARPSVTPETAEGKPLVALVVTGLGLNEAGTMGVIKDLPSEVTLAFAPYGKTLERTVPAARSEGHEILLEVPLEPFDYPDNDPGPQTLLTGQPPRANLDKLFWLMARFGGYAGLINHMGARFTASGGDFSPFMEELGARGLGYLDDGSSNRSLAPQLANSNKVPFARADIMLDADPARAPILAALEQLEAKARKEGTAIGIVSALPVSVEVLAEWSSALEERGISLVPVSALMR